MQPLACWRQARPQRGTGRACTSAPNAIYPVRARWRSLSHRQLGNLPEESHRALPLASKSTPAGSIGGARASQRRRRGRQHTFALGSRHGVAAVVVVPAAPPPLVPRGGAARGGRRSASPRVRCPRDASEEAVQDAQDHHGEWAVPGADAGGQGGRHARDQRRQPGAVQRHHPLARHPADEDWVGGRAGVRDAVPHQARRQLQVQVHHRGAGGHAVVARAQLLAQGHRLRRPHHPPQGEQDLPFRQALARSPRHPRRVVECEPGRRHPGGAEDGRRSQRLRRVHHQRPARRPVQMLPQRDDGHSGEGRRDGAAAVHQRGAQPRAVREHRAAQDDGGRRRRVLHQALHHLGAHDRAGPDHRRPRHHGPAPDPVLRRRARLRLRAERGLRQHHHHGRPRVRLRLRLRLRPQDTAGVPGAPGLQRHRRRHRLRGRDQEPRQGQDPRERRRVPLLHRRPRPLQLQAGPALPGAQQQHTLHGQHEQRLLRLPRHRLPPPRALLQDPRRLHHRLPGQPAGAVRLHGPERQPGAVAAGPRDQAVPAQVRLRRAARPAGHQHRHAREPPHPHPWLRFLHPRRGLRQLRPQQGRREVQLRRPAAAQHRGRARQRLGSHPVRRRQPRGVAHALPSGRAHHLGPGDGVPGGGRVWRTAVPGAAPS